jgi:hypothetical protein
MRILGTYIVINRGGLDQTEQWAVAHQTCTRSLRAMASPVVGAHPAIRKPASGWRRQVRPDKEEEATKKAWIKKEFLTKLATSSGEVDLESPLAALARADGRLLMVEYPSRRQIGLEDEDFGPFSTPRGRRVRCLSRTAGGGAVRA